MNEENLRREIVDYAHRLHQREWVANHDGNLSCRLGESRFLATPTAISKGDASPESLIVVDDNGGVVQGTRRAFSEYRLHRAAYAARPDIGCVIHAHPPTVTGFCVANIPFGEPFMAEPVVSLGARIPMIPFRLPNADDIFSLFKEGLMQADVLMLANHGAIAVGGSFEQAFLRLELLEHLAKILLVARQLGGVVPIPQDIVDQLCKKGRPKSNPSFGDTPTSNLRNPEQHSDPNVKDLVAEALKKHG